MTELWRLGAAELSAGFRAGDFTPVDALIACEARVATCEAVINAMVAMDSTAAHAAASASRDRWLRGAALSPLDGIPITVKDNLHVAGWPTTWGSRLLQGFIAERDELPVARLRAAGAVLCGKTNLPEFAMQGHTSNALFGVTRNPWNPALTPGGSSGGSAAAVAAGYGPLSLATDGGGSIRRPASHCGLVGFKPSADRVPRRDGLPAMFLNFEQVGAIGRNVGDVRDLMNVISDVAMTAPPPSRAKILFVPRFADHPVDEGIAMRTREAALHFSQLGHLVDEASGFDLAEEVNAQWPLLTATGLDWMLTNASRWPEFGLSAGAQLDTSLCGEAARTTLRMGHEIRAAALFDVMNCIDRLRRRLEACFQGHDFILTPATAALPWKTDDAFPAVISGRQVGPRAHAVFTAFANAGGLPAIALPCGQVDGLPTGFQLVGRPGSDAVLLALASTYEQAQRLTPNGPAFPPVTAATYDAG